MNAGTAHNESCASEPGKERAFCRYVRPAQQIKQKIQELAYAITKL